MRVDQWAVNVTLSSFFFSGAAQKLHVVRKAGVVGAQVGYSLGVKMRRALPREPHIVKDCRVCGAADCNSHGLKVGRCEWVLAYELVFHAPFDSSGYN